MSTFHPIPNYEDCYEISPSGVIRSVDRIVIGADGTKYPFKGRVLSTHQNSQTGYIIVSLYKNNKKQNLYVHRILAEVFIPNPLSKEEVNHIDGIRSNNALSNLEWVSSKENSQHAIKTGLTVYTNRLTREEFIECLYAVIDGESFASLTQRVPYKVPYLSTKVRKIAQELGVEHLLDESLYLQKAERARINGACNR